MTSGSIPALTERIVMSTGIGRRSTRRPRARTTARVFPAWEEEDLFARDFEGRLIRMDKATAADLEETIKITIDGHEITVKKAVPATDEQGNIRRDAARPRDPAVDDHLRRRQSSSIATSSHAANPIPTLCHREYMDPVGVCRVCVVQVSKFSKRTGTRRSRAASCCRPASIASRRR